MSIETKPLTPEQYAEWEQRGYEDFCNEVYKSPPEAQGNAPIMMAWLQGQAGGEAEAAGDAEYDNAPGHYGRSAH